VLGKQESSQMNQQTQVKVICCVLFNNTNRSQLFTDSWLL
jgi:hypothetical protein